MRDIAYAYKGPGASLDRAGRRGGRRRRSRSSPTTISSATIAATANSSPRACRRSTSCRRRALDARSWRRIEAARCCAPSKGISPATDAHGARARISCCSACSPKSSCAPTASTAAWAARCTPSFPPFGAYPNNAIVGASAGIATGAALRKKLIRSGGIAVANIGDGSTGCGPVWEAMNFAAMAQYDTLWTDARKGGLPVLFFFNNNFYAHGRPDRSARRWAGTASSRIGAGINPEAMHAETVDGSNPLAVADAVARKRALLLAGEGPALARRRVLSRQPAIRRRTRTPIARSEEIAALGGARSDRALSRRSWSEQA